MDLEERSGEERLIELINALGHPLRINILRLLKENLSLGLRYSKIAEKVKKKGGALDFHLNKLKRPLLIKSEKGVYRLSNAGLRAVNFFDELMRRRWLRTPSASTARATSKTHPRYTNSNFLLLKYFILLGVLILY